MLTLLTLSSLCQLSFSDKFIIHKTEGTHFEKVAWNLKVINHQPSRIKESVVFMGPSLMLNGLCDSMLNNKGIKAINLAVNHQGYEVPLFFTERIKKLHPKRIVYFKNSEKVLGNHKLNSLLFNTSSILKFGQGFNRYFVSYLLKRTRLVIEYISFSCFEHPENKGKEVQQFGSRKSNDTISNFDSLKRQEAFKEEINNLYLNDFVFGRESNGNSALLFVKKMKRKITNYLTHHTNLYNGNSQLRFKSNSQRVCAENGIMSFQLYIPTVKDLTSKKTGNTRRFYKEKGDEVIADIGNYQELDNAKYWRDFQHLSMKGAELFTNKLVEYNQFKKSLKGE